MVVFGRVTYSFGMGNHEGIEYEGSYIYESVLSARRS